MDDIVDVRGDGQDLEIQVRWKNWSGPEEWLKAAHQPELASYLRRNRANPHTSTYASSRVSAALPQPIPEELLLVRQAIFDGLSGQNATPDGHVGWHSRIHIQVPFSVQAFRSHFRQLNLDEIPMEDEANVSCYIQHCHLSQVLGTE